MKPGGIKRLFLGGFLALLVAQLLYGALMLSALYKQYQSPILQANGLLCKDIADHLGLLVRVGKSLRPSTVEKFCQPFRERTDAHDLAVTSASGDVIYRWDSSAEKNIAVPKDARQVFGDVKSFSSGEAVWTSCPVRDRKDQFAGHVLLAVEKDTVLEHVFASARDLLLLFVLITSAECLLFAFLLSFLNSRGFLKEDDGGSGGKRGLLIRGCIILPLVLGQLAFLLLLLSPLAQLYQAESQQNGYQITRQISWDLERLAGMGMSVSEIRDMENWLISRQQSMDALGMAVYDRSGLVHCAADRHGSISADEWARLKSSVPVVMRDILNKDTGCWEGSVCMALDPATADRNLRTVMLDNLTLTVVAALFLVELTYLILMGGSGLQAMLSKPDFMRPVIFACLFGTEMSMSYVPIRIGELGLELFGLPPDVVSGLPISCELFMAGAAMLIGGFWSQRSGWRPMLISGITLAGFGAVISWLSSGPLLFILARGIAGLGYGFINLSAQVFVIAHSPADQRARGLAFMFAGLYAGSLCGSALGGLIADRLGYGAVFPASAILLLVLAALLWRTLPREKWIAEASAERFNAREALDFVCNRRMGSLLLFFIIPNALITVCLFQFFVPLSLSQAGTSPASIGRVFLVYCIIVMFAGPAFGALIDRAKKMQTPLTLSLVIASASVLCLIFLDGLMAAVCSVSLLAVNTAIASNGQGAYALSLPAARHFGRSRTMGLYNVAMRIGQVLGPLSLGIMMAVWDARFGLTVLAVFTLICAALFYALSWRENEEQVQEN